MFPATFRRLEVFIAVVEAGGFIAGANRLGISHPSISNHIKALEKQVGCRLSATRPLRASDSRSPDERVGSHEKPPTW